jgi:membrane protein
MAEKSLSRFRKVQSHVRAVLGEDRLSTYGETEMVWLEKFAHFWVMVGKSFWRNRCPVRASALAYTTLLALVPMLAVGISISTSLLQSKEGEQQIEQIIDTFVAKVAPQLGLVAKSETGELSGQQKVARSIHEYIRNMSSGKLATTAILAMVFIAISLLSTIEATVNDIWGVTQGRSWFARIVQYWALITLGPIILLIIMGLNIGPHFETTKKIVEVSPLMNIIYQFLPLPLLVLAFAGFYQLMPNTKVNWRAALAGGIVGGCLWHLNNLFSVAFFGQLVARNTEIYGKLAIVPVFLIGIYFSWLIVLFGAQVAYGYQNRRAYIQERQTENVNERGREFVALRLMTFIAQKYRRGERPPASSEIAEALCVPSQLVGKVLHPLLQTKLILCVASALPDEMAYAPGRPLDQISYQDILDSIRAGTGRELDTREEPARALVREKFSEIQKAERAIAGSITLQALAENEQNRPT